MKIYPPRQRSIQFVGREGGREDSYSLYLILYRMKTANLFLSRCSTDLRQILGHSVLGMKPALSRQQH